ncbi:MAG: hypothetical protein WC492_01555 [Candidatus Micrarchaeia archaeon]
MDKKEILKKGKVDILVLHSGIRQKIEFSVVREKTPAGDVPYLKTERHVNASELFRVANEYDLPVWGTAGKFFANKKKALDYAGL